MSFAVLITRVYEISRRFDQCPDKRRRNKADIDRGKENTPAVCRYCLKSEACGIKHLSEAVLIVVSESDFCISVCLIPDTAYILQFRGMITGHKYKMPDSRQSISIQETADCRDPVDFQQRFIAAHPGRETGRYNHCVNCLFIHWVS